MRINKFLATCGIASRRGADQLIKDGVVQDVDDSALVQIGGTHHEANPFGLYYMHGNVCEWTRSDYVPYPYKDKAFPDAEYKVVRGGSFIERPKYSTSYSRKGFYPYQRVFNVGFRVILED